MNVGASEVDKSGAISFDVEKAVNTCFFSHHIGVSLKTTNSVYQNSFIQDQMIVLKDVVTQKGDEVSFYLNHNEFAYFMHQAYANSSEGKILRVNFDGIFPFEAPNEQDEIVSFNAQLVSIEEVDE